METQYVVVSKMFKSRSLGGGEVWSTQWVKIPRDHHDPEVQKMFPGYFAVHPKAQVIFLFPTK
jgi:hypothetical protein